MVISRMRGSLLPLLAILFGGTLVAAACGDDSATAPAAEPAAEPAEEESIVDEDGLPLVGTPERCELNRAAGNLIFLTGFDFAAAAGILDIVAAEAEGYFDEMCLDVELQAGLSPENSASLAAGTTQLSAIASFGELVRQNVNGGTDLIAFSQLGHTSLAELVIPAGGVESLAELQGKTIGIKGDVPTAVEAMLELGGAPRGSYTELLLDGFDPVAHLELGIDALPVFRSNEPAVLEREGVQFTEWDPLDFDVPSSFALYVNTRSFFEENPTVVEDFVRAGLRGYRFAADNPEAAVAHAFELINVAGNPFFLAEAHELNRWMVEQSTVEATTPEGFVVGQLDPETLGAEVQTMTDLGTFETLPDWESMLDTSVVPKLHDENGELIWVPMN